MIITKIFLQDVDGMAFSKLAIGFVLDNTCKWLRMYIPNNNARH